MRRINVAVVSVCFASALEFFSPCASPRAWAGDPPVRETRTPGDTNCDGKLDMSDAIFTLNYLFVGTNFPPCPLADRPELVARIGELEADLGRTSAALEACSGELAVVGADLTAAERDLATCRSDLESAIAGQSVLQQQAQELQAQLEGAHGDLATCHAELAGAVAARAELEERAQEAQAQLGNAQADLSTCQSQLADCRTGSVAGLPDTGQAKCYDQAGTEIPCESSTCAGQDGFYSTGCPSEGRFVDNGDGTVSDNCTGLMWQKDTADVNGDGQSTNQDWATWCNALAYCENLSFAGHDDWRLPNLNELRSIVVYKPSTPRIDPVFGPVWSDYFWSSTSYTDGSPYAWIINASDGLVNFDRKDNNGPHVRAVRNAP